VPDHGHSAKRVYLPTVSSFFLTLSLTHSHRAAAPSPSAPRAALDAPRRRPRPPPDRPSSRPCPPATPTRPPSAAPAPPAAPSPARRCTLHAHCALCRAAVPLIVSLARPRLARAAVPLALARAPRRAPATNAARHHRRRRPPPRAPPPPPGHATRTIVAPTRGINFLCVNFYLLLIR
jgi:hypothetical protein